MTMFGSPPIPDWLQQAPSDASMPPMQPNIAPSMMQTGQVKQKRGGMFGSGLNAGEVIVNLLNGALAAQGNPVGLANIKMMQEAYREKQRKAQDDAEYARKRQDSLVDYEAKQKIDQQYPTAPQPTEYERLLAAMGVQPGTPQYQEHIGRFVGAKENPIVMTPYGPMPYSAVNGGGQQAPAKPLTDEDILRMQGGPTPQASGGFPGWINDY